MEISRKRVLSILKYLDENPDFYFPFEIICKDYNKNNEYFDVNCLDIERKYIYDNKSIKTFVLIENLQKIDKETIGLMVKGFIDKIENSSIVEKIYDIATEYREIWKVDLCESKSILEYGENEFFGGKAEAFEDCAQIIKEYDS